LWKSSRFKLERYWRPDFGRTRHDSEAVLVDELDELLRETVKMHTLSDVRVGAFVSGGIDSSTVAAIMATQQSEPVPSFTIGVEQEQFNELPYARKVSEKYGMEAHERIVRPDLVQLMPRMIHHMDEPSDPFGVGVYLASALARETVKVVLSGDGGDENFAGYDRFAGQQLVDYYCIVPRWFRSSVMRRIIRRIPESFGYKSIAQKAAWLNEMSLSGRGERYAHSLCFLRFMPEAKERLFTSHGKSLISDGDSTAKVLEHFDAAGTDDLVDRMLYTDLMTRLPDHLLALGDRMSMAHSLESRPVLVDHKVVDFAAGVPSHLKLKGRTLKYLLKQVAARYLPQDVLNRPKQGFSFPIGMWMRSELRDFVTNLFRESRFVREGIFEQAYIQEIWNEHLTGRADHNYRLWVLINLEFWFRLYFENESVESLCEDTTRLMAA
jgi:asparagine synthase (glutamine-hydrolysing)